MRFDPDTVKSASAESWPSDAEMSSASLTGAPASIPRSATSTASTRVPWFMRALHSGHRPNEVLVSAYTAHPGPLHKTTQLQYVMPHPIPRPSNLYEPRRIRLGARPEQK